MSGQIIGGPPKYAQSGTGTTVTDKYKRNHITAAISLSEDAEGSAEEIKNQPAEFAVKSQEHLDGLTAMDIQNLDVAIDPKKEIMQVNHLLRTVGESETNLKTMQTQEISSETAMNAGLTPQNFMTLDEKPNLQHINIDEGGNNSRSNFFHRKRQSAALPSTYTRSEIQAYNSRLPAESQSTYKRDPSQNSAE